jgi:hypothetical protein
VHHRTQGEASGLGIDLKDALVPGRRLTLARNSVSHSRSWRRSLYGCVAAGVVLTPSVFILRNVWLTRSPPRIEVSAQTLDLGEGKPNQRMSGSFIISNVGHRELEYTIEASCGCTAVQPPGGSLPRGASEQIRVTLDLPGSTGTKRDINLLIKSNDLSIPALLCSVSATCPRPLTAIPGYIDFGDVTAGDISRAHQVIILRNRLGQPLHESESVDIACRSPYIVVARERDHSGDACLRVSLSPSIPIGKTSDVLYVRPHASDVALEIPIQASRVAFLGVAPPTLFLGTGLPIADHEVHIVFVWRNGSVRDPGKLIAFKGPTDVVVSDHDTIGSGPRRLEISVPRSLVHSRSEQVRLTFARVPESVIVTLLPSS